MRVFGKILSCDSLVWFPLIQAQDDDNDARTISVRALPANGNFNIQVAW